MEHQERVEPLTRSPVRQKIIRLKRKSLVISNSERNFESDEQHGQLDAIPLSPIQDKLILHLSEDQVDEKAQNLSVNIAPKLHSRKSNSSRMSIPRHSNATSSASKFALGYHQETMNSRFMSQSSKGHSMLSKFRTQTNWIDTSAKETLEKDTLKIRQILHNIKLDTLLPKDIIVSATLCK